MKKAILIALATVACQLAFAQTPDAIYKLVRHQWTVNADGTSDYRYRHEVQILRNRALVAYADKGETFVVYNPDLEELTVNEVYTIQADGRRVDMTPNAFVYQLPAECADCGRFSHMRELAMVHTGMELGCTVVVDYTIHRRYDLVNQTIQLPRECPVERLEVTISVPESQKLGIQLDNGYSGIDFGHYDVEQDEHFYSLVGTNLPQTFTDAYLPAALYPTLHFYNGTPQWTPELNDGIYQGANAAMGTTITSRNKRENIVAVRDFLVDNLHLNDIDPVHLAYRHATPSEVWRSGCGTATDKAVLLAAILRAHNYNAQVVGEQADEVSILLDTLEYRLGVRSKSPLTLYGEAHDEVSRFTTNTTVDAELDTLSDGFYRLALPSVPGAPSMAAAYLALTRTAPLRSQACDLQSTITIPLPAGLKMVGGSVSHHLEYEGVGRLDISIKQSGKKLKVQRNLKLEQSVVPPADYSHFRQLLATWQSVDKVLLRSK